MAPTRQHCAKCGTTLPVAAARGLCPRCLLRMGLSQGRPLRRGAADTRSIQRDSTGDEPIGKELGGYRVVSRLGEGGMGVVYKAWDNQLRRTVALKVPGGRLAGDPAFASLIERFKEEARAAASVSHPNICPIYTMGEDQGVHFFAMEYVRGTNLAEHIKAHGPLELPRVLNIATQTASALAVAHRAGLVHRDIKPANIMLTRPRRVGRPSPTSTAGGATEAEKGGTELPEAVRVMDFGLAQWTEAEARITARGGFLGTLVYASPEQCADRELDGRSNLYSLGVVLYEALTGRLPYAADTPAALVAEIQSAAPLALADLPEAVPAEVREILAQLLARNPEDRIPSARVLCDRLREALGGFEGLYGVRVVLVVGESTGTEREDPGGAPEAPRRPPTWLTIVGDLARDFPGAHDVPEDSDGGQAHESDRTERVFSFARPSDAVRFALAAQARLNASSIPPEDEPLPGMGIHMGETDPSRKSPARTDPVVCAAKLLADLTEPGQILLTQGVFDAARERVESGPDGATLSWLAHGPYAFEGVEAPLGICEVGIAGLSPLHPPATAAAHARERAAFARNQVVLGWRPAIEQQIPQRHNWVLSEKRGEGGFGEVWLATHAKTHAKRIFKFCFEAARVRSLKREVTLFRLLKETLGKRDDITDLIDWQFEEPPPYFIESQYTEEGSLLDWAESRGGIEKVALHDRLEIVAQAADAVAAAHSVGVLHKDIKPANILIGEAADGPRAILTDFGVGLLTRRDILLEHGITQKGLTGITLFADEASSSGAGTRLYMAPELLEGGTPTTRCDVFSLGVLLYQMVSGDFSRALTVGWQRHIEDDLIAQDVRACVEGEPERRLSSAEELARRLRALPERRRKLQLEARLRTEVERSRRRRRALTVSAGVGAVFLVCVSYFALRAEMARRQSERERYFANILVAGKQIDGGQYAAAIKTLWEMPEHLRNWEWGYLINKTHGYEFSLDAHHDAVQRCVFDPGGKRLLTASRDGSARIWDCETGRQIQVFGPSAGGHRDALADAAWSPDGNRVVTASDDGTAIVWNLRTGRPDFVLTGHSGPVHAASFTSGGTRILTGANDSARVWDAATGRCLHVFGMIGSGQAKPSVKWAVPGPDGTRIAASNAASITGAYVSLDWHPLTTVWNVETGEAVCEIHGFRPRFSPDGRRIVALTTPTGLAVFDARSGEMLHDINPQAHVAGIRVAEFSPDGNAVATGGEDAMAKIWNARPTGKWEGRSAWHVLRGHAHSVANLAWSPDGRWVATVALDGTCCLWDTLDGTRVRTLIGHQATVLDVAFSGETRWIATASEDGTAKLWRTGAEDPTSPFPPDYEWVQNRTVFSRDGKRLAAIEKWNFAKVTDVATGVDLLRIGNVGRFDGVDLSADGKRLWVKMARMGWVGAWDVDTGQVAVEPFKAHDAPIHGIRLDHTGARLVTASGDGTAKVFDADGATSLLLGGTHSHDQEVYDADFSPDGKRVVTVSRDQTARVWNARTGAFERAYERRDGGIKYVAFSPDGRRVVTAHGRLARVWNPATGKDILALEGHTGALVSACFSPDGTRILTAGWDESVRVWDARTGKELTTLGHAGDTVWSEDGWGAMFHPEGRLIVAGSICGLRATWEAAPWRLGDLPGDASMNWKDRFDLWRRERNARRQDYRDVRNEWEALLALESEPLRTRAAALDRSDRWTRYCRLFSSTVGGVHGAAENLRDWYADWLPPPSPGDPVIEPGTTETVDLGAGFTLELAWAPAGEFVIGSPPGEPFRNPDEGPATWLPMRGFWMGKTEVTVAQFRRFVEETGYVTDAEKQGGAVVWWKNYFVLTPELTWRNPRFVEDYEWTDRHPALCLSWDDAMAFCDWLSTRTGDTFTLPTEAQLEYALRAGSRTAWYGGDSPEDGRGLWNGLDKSGWDALGRGDLKWPLGGDPFPWDDGAPYPAPVGSYPPNAWGLNDIAGNAFEWCLSAMEPYPYREDETRNPRGSCTSRVVRGPDFSFGAAWGRNAWRWGYVSDCPMLGGMRVVRLP